MLKTKMNEVLANYETMYHKLQTYHWYVKGKDFFTAHAQLEEYYDEFFEAIDEIAEKLLMIGGEPLANLTEFSKLATISEAQGTFVDSETVFASVKTDFEILRKQVDELREAAESENNALIVALCDELTGSLSKHLWMLGQMLA